ncbi:MAG TPA: hypothetical protein VNI20_04950, partial [Fimbriimonadaceae bacterium]|nr:hypothetical protein [Fimbriimonadaceae bacterium]
IPPATTTMEIDSGVYKQVMDARTYLLGRAKRHADELAKAGEYDRAAEAYMDAIELGYIAKYSEFGIMTESAAKQSRFVIGIEKILPHVSEEGRQDILARLNRLDLGQKSFAYVVDHYAGAYQKDLHRLGQPNSLIEAARDTKYVASAATDDQVRIDRWEAVTLADRDLLPLFGSGRVAQTSERDYVARLSTLIHDLQPAPTTWN